MDGSCRGFFLSELVVFLPRHRGSQAVTLLQHFWSSRCSESDLRSKLCEEAARLLGALKDLVPSLEGLADRAEERVNAAS